MRFLLPSIALLFLGFIGFSSADLRYASTPKTAFATRDRANSVAFTTKLALYMEPSTFGYAGLAAQKKNNYDNFLRSNIDNEQDNRNFNNEAGKDHLPFRTLEARSTDATGQLPADVALTVEPGKEYVLPLRWNNPHASEMEINIWINQNTIVVPIKKPVCSGEGYQDGVISFIVPTDFNDLGSKVAGFNGCQKTGDCVLQMYAHSVEPRTYAAGTPVIVSGWDATKPKAADNSQVQPASRDPGTDLSKQANDVCLPSNDPSSNIPSAIPRFARQVSDVYNHAYQNSDYSPYSGQQAESISKTMQAAGILRMVNGNRGELGQSILTQQQKNTLANLRNTANNVVKNLEGLTNKIINQVLKNGAKSTGTVAGTQQLNNCFRCLETSSVSANRLQTNTYVPSFKIANADQLAQARQIIQQTNAKYANLINAQGVLSIYQTALQEMAPAYQQLQAKYGLSYQPAKEKPTAATLADATGFRKVNAAGQQDGGKYAATQAKKAAASAKNGGAPTTKDANAINDEDMYGLFSFEFGGESNLLGGIDISVMSGNEVGLLSIPGGELSPNVDDEPSKQQGYLDREDVVNNLPVGATDASVAADGSTPGSASACSSSSSGMSVPMVAGIAGAGGAALAGVIAAGIFYQQKKQQQSTNTNTRVFNDARV